MHELSKKSEIHAVRISALSRQQGETLDTDFVLFSWKSKKRKGGRGKKEKNNKKANLIFIQMHFDTFRSTCIIFPVCQSPISCQKIILPFGFTVQKCIFIFIFLSVQSEKFDFGLIALVFNSNAIFLAHWRIKSIKKFSRDRRTYYMYSDFHSFLLEFEVLSGNPFWNKVTGKIDQQICPRWIYLG